MGIRLVVEVLYRSPPELTYRERLVLIAIAESARDSTRTGWPGRHVVAGCIGASEQTVKKIITGLVARGHLERVGGGYRGRRVEYRLPVKADTATSAFTGGKGGTSATPISQQKGGTSRDPITAERGYLSDRKGVRGVPPIPQSPQDSPHPRARADEIAAVVEALAERTGKTITEDHARLVVAQLVGNRTGIRDRCRYLAGAIRRDDTPERFLPTPQPPPYRREDRPA